MKKIGVFIILLTLIIVLSFSVLSIKITGETVTGKAASRPTNISISILPAVPTLNLIKPRNETYLTNTSIPLQYEVSNAEKGWYNLEGGENITITSLTSPIYFNTSQGSHTLYLYANNTAGETTKNITFTVNSTRFIIIDDEYEKEEDEYEDKGEMRRNEKKGSSTEFLDYTYEEIQNLTGITLENDYGKIFFNRAINITNDSLPTDNILNLNNNTNISLNRIELNSTALPNFNTSAILWLYNLTFSNPRILRNGEVCPSTICIKESYSSGILKFNVTSFSVYSAEETPVTLPAAPPTGGGGGRGIGFEVTPKKIEVRMKQGKVFKTILKIKNLGKSPQNFTINKAGLEDFLIIKEKEIILNPGEEKEINLIFIASTASTHTGKLIISIKGAKKEIPILLEVKSRILLFDVILKIPPKYKNIQANESLTFDVRIFDLGEMGKTNLSLEYYIKDFEGGTIVKEKENITIETQVSFSKTLRLPKDIPDGQYLAGVDVKYDISLSTASDTFNVGKPKIKFYIIYLLGIGILFIIIIGVILILRYYTKRLGEITTKYTQEMKEIEGRIKKGHIKMKEANKMINRLNAKSFLLTKAFEKGYIKKESYEKSRKRINKIKRELKKKYL